MIDLKKGIYMSKDKKTENVHKGHRERLKNKFLNHSEAVLSEHEFLELLLFFSVPQKNTNELAHKLLAEFGSFSQLIEADYEVLRNIEGVKDHTACLLKVALSCASKYISEKNDISKMKITPHNIGTFAKNLFLGHNEEVSYALLLDKDCYIKKVKRISIGTMGYTPIYPREIVKFALSQNEPYLIMMHNHPNGTAQPSEADIETTKSLINALSYVDVRLVDHVIVAGNNTISLAKDYGLF